MHISAVSFPSRRTLLELKILIGLTRLMYGQRAFLTAQNEILLLRIILGYIRRTHYKALSLIDCSYNFTPFLHYFSPPCVCRQLFCVTNNG